MAIRDSLGNMYSVVVGPVVTNNLVHYIAIASSSPAGSDTATVTLSAAPGGWEMLVLEYAGLAASAPFDFATRNPRRGCDA